MAVEGIDVSNNQGPINWDSVKAAGKRFACIKATEGVFFHDGYFHGHWASAMHHELWRCAYHYARPGRGPSGADEANYFCEYVLRAPQLQGDMYALDLEEGPPGADLGAYVLDWCQTVEGATGVKPLIYSTSWMLVHWKCDIPELAPYGLWIAAPGASNWPAPPSNWPMVAIWQYDWHGRVSGVKGDCDLDRFNGSEDEMFAYGAP